jgi:hypothetical protein
MIAGEAVWASTSFPPLVKCMDVVPIRTAASLPERRVKITGIELRDCGLYGLAGGIGAPTTSEITARKGNVRVVSRRLTTRYY